MLKSPSTRPRMVSGAFICTSVCVMLLNDSSKNPAQNSNAERERIRAHERERRAASAAHSMREQQRRRGLVAQRGRRASRAGCRRAARRPHRRRAAACRRRRDRRARGLRRSPASAPGSCCRRRTTRRPRAAPSTPSTGIPRTSRIVWTMSAKPADRALGGPSLPRESCRPYGARTSQSSERQVERGVEEDARAWARACA